jgi:hypothetical protein
MQTFGQPRVGEDLKAEIDVLLGNDRDMKYLSLFNFLPKNFVATAHKHEWIDDSIPATNFTFARGGTGTDWDDAADTTGLPVVTAQITKLRVGDVIRLPLPAGAGELVVVKSISISGQTIDVWSRGHGSTTGTAQGASGTAEIVGNTQIDGSDPMDPSYAAPTEKYNVVQIFEDDLAVSGKVMRSRSSRETERSRQRALKLKRLLKMLNRTLWEGYLEEDTTNSIYTFRGIRESAATTYNINGALDVAKIYGCVEAMITAGGSPSAIHAHPTVIGRIERLMSSYVVAGVSEYNAKLTVNKLSMLGQEIELHADRDCVNTELWVLDYSRLAFGPMSSDEASGEFQAVTITENLKQIKEQIAGYYTMEQRNATAAIVKGYGCSS